MPVDGWLLERLEFSEERLASFKATLPAVPTKEQEAGLWQLERECEHAYTKASEAWDRECEDAERRQWVSEMTGAPGFDQ